MCIYALTKCIDGKVYKVAIEKSFTFNVNGFLFLPKHIGAYWTIESSKKSYIPIPIEQIHPGVRSRIISRYDDSGRSTKQ